MKVVFIGGYARSGTTLLGSMLGAHPEYVCTPESQFKVSILTRKFPDWETKGIEPDKAIEAIRNHWRFRLWEHQLGSPSSRLSTYADVLSFLVDSYADQIGKPHPTAWIDHTPPNIKYPDLLFKLFPEARMIHIVRDGRGVAASLVGLDWGPHTVDRVARIWRKRILMGMDVEKRFGPEKVTRVRFEDLLNDPQGTLQTLCSFAGLDFHPDMLTGGGFHVPRYTSNQHALVGKAPDASRADAWRQKLRPREIEIFESFAWDALEGLGYETMFGADARLPNKFEELSFRAQQKIKDYFRKKRLERKRRTLRN